MARNAVYIAVHVGSVWGGCRVDGGDDVGRSGKRHR